jgi:hypothetical protein
MNINLTSGERLETGKYFLPLQQKPIDIHFPLRTANKVTRHSFSWHRSDLCENHNDVKRHNKNTHSSHKTVPNVDISKATPMMCLCKHRKDAEVYLQPIRNLDTRRGWMASTSPLLLYPRRSKCGHRGRSGRARKKSPSPGSDLGPSSP